MKTILYNNTITLLPSLSFSQHTNQPNITQENKTHMNKPRNLALSPSSGSHNFKIGPGKRYRVVKIKQLKPDFRLNGNFSEDEDELIIKLHALLGNRWCLIAGRLPGRTENEVKKHWDSFLKMKLINMGIDPNNHRLHHHHNINLHRQKHQIYNNNHDHEPSSSSVSESCDQEMNSSSSRGTHDLPDLNIGLNTMTTKKVASLNELSDSSSTAQETHLLFR